jgi:D-alanyl-D-alanine carboxypeptidase (penicillin-binding protein 5/6)
MREAQQTASVAIKFFYILRVLRPALLFAFLSCFTAALCADNFPDELELGSRSAVLMDAATGTILYYKNPDLEISPASLTKLMTMHLLFRGIEAGRFSPDTQIQPKPESWARNQPYRSSLMGLARGQVLSLRELLLGLAVASGNDAAVAAALEVSPSVKDFVHLMNQEAAALGLSKTRFVEPSGISENNMTTAREFAVFCRFYIQQHPGALSGYHSIQKFVYPKAENVAEIYRDNPMPGTRNNNNPLLGKFPGVDGLKTGYIDEAGHNIALTAERDGTRFIAVILGAPAEWGGDKIREEDSYKILNWAFNNYKTVRPLFPEIEEARVWKGKKNSVPLRPGESLEFTAPINRADKLYRKTEIISPLIAPLPAGSYCGELVLYDDEGELRRIPLLSAEEAPPGGFFKRLWDSIRLLFKI